MKYSQWIGILAAIAVSIACFYPWAFYPDLNTYFTGFYSHENIYGKPGKVLIFFAVLATLFFALPKLWAKRANWLVCAIAAAFALKTYILYTSCYRGICPDKQIAMYIVLIAPFIMLTAAFLPKTK
jgi:hypothetical protein